MEKLIKGEKILFSSSVDHRVSGFAEQAFDIEGMLYLTHTKLIFDPIEKYYKKYGFDIPLSSIFGIKSYKLIIWGPFLEISCKKDNKNLNYIFFTNNSFEWDSKIRQIVSSKLEVDRFLIIKKSLFIIFFSIVVIGLLMLANGDELTGIFGWIFIFSLIGWFIIIFIFELRELYFRKIKYKHKGK